MAIDPIVDSAGSFVPTTLIYDVAQLYETDIKSPEFKELLVRLYQTTNLISLVLNTKNSGYNVLQEFLTGALLFPVIGNAQQDYRQISRMVVNFGALPAAGTKTVAHNIQNVTTDFSVTRVIGASTNPVIANMSFIPIPYASAGANNNDNLELFADDTNVYITTGGKDYSAWTNTYVFLEYVKT